MTLLNTLNKQHKEYLYNQVLNFVDKDYFRYVAGTKFVDGNLVLDIGNKKSKADILMALYELKKGIGHWEDALAYFEECVALRNEIRTADAEKQIANLKVGYDLELKEREMIAVEHVLHNVLPQKIAARIRAGEEQIVERFSQASVLFADIVGPAR